jgi:hypothetical protein
MLFRLQVFIVAEIKPTSRNPHFEKVVQGNYLTGFLFPSRASSTIFLQFVFQVTIPPVHDVMSC